jgi:transketolase
VRTTFIRTLCDLAEADPKIWLLTGDLGFSVLERFRDAFPARFVNCGVAEQNMMGIAAGLALSGATAFVYSIANFPVFRCLEQIRNDVAYHNANVKIVAVGGGLAYGSAGYSHHAVEDLAVMRALPNMTVVAPADPVETRLATCALARQSGPAYLRLGKANEPVLYSAAPPFAIGRAIEVRPGTDCTLISTGATLGITLAAADLLAASGCRARVISLHTLRPFDAAPVEDALATHRAIVTVEEHGVPALGAAVAETIAASGIGCRFRALSLGAEPCTMAGTQEELRAARGLSPEGIATAVRSLTT